MKLHDAFETCMQLTQFDNAGRTFWGAHQSFFKQVNGSSSEP